MFSQCVLAKECVRRHLFHIMILTTLHKDYYEQKEPVFNRIILTFIRISIFYFLCFFLSVTSFFFSWYPFFPILFYNHALLPTKNVWSFLSSEKEPVKRGVGQQCWACMQNIPICFCALSWWGGSREHAASLIWIIGGWTAGDPQQKIHSSASSVYLVLFLTPV